MNPSHGTLTLNPDGRSATRARLLARGQLHLHGQQQSPAFAVQLFSI
jgi:hypothetical protein